MRRLLQRIQRSARLRAVDPRAPGGALRRALAAALVALLPALPGCDALSWAERDDVLVLVRAGDAGGWAIAEAYAARRRLAPERTLELTLSAAASATVIETGTYLDEIAAPIEAYLREADPEGRVRILVTTRGLPLLVEDCTSAGECRRASLDAALAQLGRTAEGVAFERRPNPYFGAGEPFAPGGSDDLRFLVARLTAPASRARGPSGGTQRDAERDPTGIPALLQDALDAPDPEAEIAGPQWLIASSSASGSRSPAAGLLLDPIAEQLPRWGHGVCDGCDPRAPHEQPFGGVVLSSTASTTDSATATAPRSGAPGREPLRLSPPGLVVSLTATPVDGPEGGRGRLDATLADWLSRGATALTLHLGDPDLSSVARPLHTLRAWARGATAVEAHFAGLPLLGGAHLFVGDPLRALPTPEPIDAVAADLDGDGIEDRDDNCPLQSNRDQRDTDGDGFGNRCDADLDGDGLVDTSLGRIYPLDERGDLETMALAARQGAYDPDLDLDGDGAVDARDLVIVRLGLFRPPGR